MTIFWNPLADPLGTSRGPPLVRGPQFENRWPMVLNLLRGIGRCRLTHCIVYRLQWLIITESVASLQSVIIRSAALPHSITTAARCSCSPWFTCRVIHVSQHHHHQTLWFTSRLLRVLSCRHSLGPTVLCSISADMHGLSLQNSNSEHKEIKIFD